MSDWTSAPATTARNPRSLYWLGQPHWRNGYGREAVAAIIDYGLRNLGIATIRAYTDPTNLASQKVLLRCGLHKIGEIELIKPNGAHRCSASRSRGLPK